MEPVRHLIKHVKLVHVMTGIRQELVSEVVKPEIAVIIKLDWIIAYTVSNSRVKQLIKNCIILLQSVK